MKITMKATAMVLAAVFLTGSTARAEPTHDALAKKCETGKLKEVGSYASCLLKADAKARLRNEAPQYLKCEAKFTVKWAKLEEKAGPGVCPTEGDAAAVMERIRKGTTEVTSFLGGNSTQPTVLVDGLLIDNGVVSVVLDDEYLLEGDEVHVPVHRDHFIEDERLFVALDATFQLEDGALSVLVDNTYLAGDAPLSVLINNDYRDVGGQLYVNIDQNHHTAEGRLYVNINQPAYVSMYD